MAYMRLNWFCTAGETPMQLPTTLGCGLPHAGNKLEVPVYFRRYDVNAAVLAEEYYEPLMCHTKS
jgi:hypothetical protein